MSEAAAAHSHALVVGIESYDGGDSWRLDGPASDAVRMLEYISACGVPKEHVKACLAPLPEHTALLARAQELASTVAAPTQGELDHCIERWMPSLDSDLLLIFWAGHGVITVDDERRLYT